MSKGIIDHYTNQLVEAWLEGKWGQVICDIRKAKYQANSAAFAVDVFEKLNRRMGQGNVQACEFYRRIMAVPSYLPDNAWAHADPPLAPCERKTKAECKACETHLGSGQCEYLEDLDEPDEGEPRDQAWQTVDGLVNQDGTSVSVHVATNDNLDKGYPSEHSEWDSACTDVLAFLRRYGVSRVGCSGVQVKVTLNGKGLTRYEPECPNCGAEAISARHGTDPEFCGRPDRLLIEFDCGGILDVDNKPGVHVWEAACPQPLKVGDVLSEFEAALANAVGHYERGLGRKASEAEVAMLREDLERLVQNGS